MKIVRFDRLVTPPVDDLSLLVHHVVIIDQPLANLEVVCLDLSLRALDALGDQRMRDDLAFLHTQPVHHAGDPFGPEQPHQVVLQRQVKLGGARVALSTRPSAKLPVDSPRFVTLGTDNVQPARNVLLALRRVHRIAVPGIPIRAAGSQTTQFAPDYRVFQLDIGTAPSHVGGDGNRSRLAGVRHDFRFCFVLLCV